MSRSLPYSAGHVQLPSRVLLLYSPCASRHQVLCSANRVVPRAHRVVGPGTHQGSGPREVHTTPATQAPPAAKFRPTQDLSATVEKLSGLPSISSVSSALPSSPCPLESPSIWTTEPLSAHGQRMKKTFVGFAARPLRLFVIHSFVLSFIPFAKDTLDL
jgi:hypothetical protein